jgi:hypothetical protein
MYADKFNKKLQNNLNGLKNTAKSNNEKEELNLFHLAYKLYLQLDTWRIVLCLSHKKNCILFIAYYVFINTCIFYISDNFVSF